MRCKNPESIRYVQVAVVVEELYKCYTEDYVCVIRKVYKRIRTTRIRQQWFPGHFFSNWKRPGYEASLLVEPEWKNHDIKRGGYTTYFFKPRHLFSILAKCVSMCSVLEVNLRQVLSKPPPSVVP